MHHLSIVKLYVSGCWLVEKSIWVPPNACKSFRMLQIESPLIGIKHSQNSSVCRSLNLIQGCLHSKVNGLNYTEATNPFVWPTWNTTYQPTCKLGEHESIIYTNKTHGCCWRDHYFRVASHERCSRTLGLTSIENSRNRVTYIRNVC